MDKVSPALQFGGLDQVETCSWESSSPHTCQSPGELSVHAVVSCPQTPSSSDIDPPEIYSVMTMEGYPSRSRESTTEPLSPGSLQTLQKQDSVLCKSEEQSDDEYSCTMPLVENAALLAGEPEVKEKAYVHGSSTTMEDINAFGDYSKDRQVEPHRHHHQQRPPSSPEEPPAPPTCAAPQSLRFGTYLLQEKQDKNIMISLEGADLWHQFYQVGTEMIITKSGRRMFPGIVISVGGLEPDSKYSFSLEFNPVDNARYKYINTKWVNIGKAEAHSEEMLKYVHSESPSTGKHWMSSKISFKKIKVTNNKNHKKGLVVALNSMHKYQPRVVISKFFSKRNVEPIFTHDLVECSFIGVTAYQNDRVTQLKIDHNPFAKAFRESSSETESYGGYGMVGTWPPISPLLSPYGTAGFSPDGQALPMLSPSCIPSAGPSPLPQFNSAFCNWELPPYSPSYRTPFQNPASLPSPTLLPDHRQVTPSRLMTQESPPISPLLYQPGVFTPASHTQLPGPPSSSLHISQQKPLPGSIPEIWVPKTDYVSVGMPALAFEVSSSAVGYGAGVRTSLPVLPQPQHIGFPVAKIEHTPSPSELHNMEP